jgi:hypothetical protein
MITVACPWPLPAAASRRCTGADSWRAPPPRPAPTQGARRPARRADADIAQCRRRALPPRPRPPGTTAAPRPPQRTDYDNAAPFFSRCLRVPLAWHEHAPNVAGPLTQAFAERARQIAQSENLDGRPLSAYLQLVLECRHNLREMLSRIQAGAMLD